MHDTTEADFRAYMTARWPRLLRTAYLLTGHHQDAEDLARSALARAYSRWARVSGARDPDAYVWRVMINLHRDRQRRASVREWVTSRLPERTRGDRSEQLAARGRCWTRYGGCPPGAGGDRAAVSGGSRRTPGR